MITLDVRDDIDETTIDGCFAWFQRVDDLFSTWRDDTEIMRLGAGTLARADVSAEVEDVLELCEAVRLESAGAFDISVGALPDLDPRPGRAPLDPSGLVKGWAVSCAGAILRDAGATNFYLSAGGDLIAAGHPDESRNGWRVGIQHPWERDRVAAVLEISDAAVATSGCYERGDHVIDPRSGRPAIGLASVTVVGPDLAIADAYATAAMVLGRVEGMVWLAGRVGYEGLGVTDDHRIVTTTGLGRYRIT
jgi:thiamine biosynthesis lipoprotein